MALSLRELWTTAHGLILGALLLLLLVGTLAELHSSRQRWVTLEGIERRIRHLRTWTLTLAIVSWATVISGTYIAYPWYRAKPPEDGNLLYYPQFFLLSRAATRGWHTFAAMWKEHIGWFVPILTTALAYLVAYYGPQLAY